MNSAKVFSEYKGRVKVGNHSHLTMRPQTRNRRVIHHRTCLMPLLIPDILHMLPGSKLMLGIGIGLGASKTLGDRG